MPIERRVCARLDVFPASEAGERTLNSSQRAGNDVDRAGARMHVRDLETGRLEIRCPRPLRGGELGDAGSAA